MGYPTGLIYVDAHNIVVTPPKFPSRECKNAGGTWDKDARAWRFPRYTLYLQAIRDLYPGLREDASVNDLDADTTGRVSAWHIAIGHNGAQTPLQSSFAKLYPYQREAVGALIDAPHAGALLALSPGLGKTAVSLISAAIIKAKRVLIVAPLSLLPTWRDEAAKWAPGHPVTMLHGDAPTAAQDGWFVTNYDTVRTRVATYATQPWDVVILDESVLLKNRNSKRFKAICEVRKSTKRTWLLSGSPTTKFADDLYAQLHVIDPTAFRSYWRFAERYCYIESNNYGQQITGTKVSHDVNNDLRDVMFVRNQKDVLADLPDYIEKPITVVLGKAQRKAHDDMLNQFVADLGDDGKVKAAIVISQLIRLQQIASGLANVSDRDESAKADVVENLIAESSVELPMIVWTQWVPGAQALERRIASTFPDLAVRHINGGNPSATNDQLFAAYKRGDIDVLILSLAIGKFGHTLTNTKTVVYYDVSWNADDYVQSLHRVKRIGLAHSPVLIRLHAENTVDDLVEENLAGKLPSIAKISNADLATMLKGINGNGTGHGA